MTWYADLAPIDYFGPHMPVCLRAVGWLAHDSEYLTGSVPREFFERLKQLAASPWQPFAAGGVHACELCQFEAEARNGANLFIPHEDTIFVAPCLIVHYVNAHRYAPPRVFQEAVMNCPDQQSMDYKKQLLASGWRSAAHRLSDP